MQSLLHDPRLMGCRRLFLRDHDVLAHIGVHSFEKQAAQRLLINIDLYVPLQHSTPMRDNLAEVVDYDFIRRCVAKRLSQGPIELQETLCDDLLALMLAHPHVKAARVSTEKPDVYADCAGIGCEVFAMKERS